MFSIDNLRKKRNALEKEVQVLSTYLTNEDPAHLMIRHHENGSYYYTRKYKDENGKWKETYLPQSSINDIKKLAYRQYVSERLKDVQNELRLINHILRFHITDSNVRKYMQRHPGVYALLKDWIFTKGDDALLAPDDEIRRKAEIWKNTPYKRSQTNPEWLKYPTVVKGLFTRSKSESDIVSRFEYFGAAYHYEEHFELPEHLLNLYRRNSFEIHPDFKCKNIRTGNIFWWEHQGQWDNPSYVFDLPSREELLFKAGLVPWKNLIITTETKDLPLDIGWVDEIIRFFLL